MSDLLDAAAGLGRLRRGGRHLEASTCACSPGESLAVLGRNGTGKTTLLNTIIGVTRHRGGTITLDGRDITRRGPRSGRMPGSAGCRRSATSSSR